MEVTQLFCDNVINSISLMILPKVVMVICVKVPWVLSDMQWRWPGTTVTQTKMMEKHFALSS